MEDSKIIRTETVAGDGTPVRFVYDQETDILEVLFGENEPATGVELTDQILLRLNRKTRRAVGLVLRHFSILTESTEYGPRGYPLEKLDEAPDDLRELALRLATSMPVRQFLKIAHFQASKMDQIPLTYVETPPMLAVTPSAA